MVLRVIEAEPLGAGIIELLEEALTRARNGEMSSCAIATVDREGFVESGWSKAPSMPLLIASVDRLKYKLHQGLDEAKP